MIYLFKQGIFIAVLNLQKLYFGDVSRWFNCLRTTHRSAKVRIIDQDKWCIAARTNKRFHSLFSSNVKK